MSSYYVYIVTNTYRGTLYTGVTNNIERRALEHAMGLGSVFTRKYKLSQLVWYEEHGDINEAILREKRIKRWPRKWKFALIEANNPSWADLVRSRVDADPRSSRG